MDNQLYRHHPKKRKAGEDDIFFEILDRFYRRSEIRIVDMVALINCIEEIEEIRDVVHSDIDNLIFYCLENEGNIYKLIYFLKQSHSKYLRNPEQIISLKSIFVSIYAGEMSLNYAVSML